MISPPTLHAPVLKTAEDYALVGRELSSIDNARRQRLKRLPPLAPPAPSIEVPLTTISREWNFDALVHIRFREAPESSSPCLWDSVGAPGNPSPCLIVDSGNSTLVVPDFACIEKLPHFNENYTILADQTNEPFGCPAKILRGPIQIFTTAGFYEITKCVFYACTDVNDQNQRTANFGLGWISPWWQTNVHSVPTMQPPLTYDNSHPHVEIKYAPAATVLATGRAPKVAERSALVLRQAKPPGYRTFDIIGNLLWMSLEARSLTIGPAKTGWPGAPASGASPAIAMVDTGGGPVFLSDPHAYVYADEWPQQVACPDWAITSGSTPCRAVSDPLTIELGDNLHCFSYQIDTQLLPEAVQDLTLVMCKKCYYMMDNYGMNIGGISALFNYILIDYQNGKVGFMTKEPALI